MNRRQFLVLFLCNLIPWWIGSGLVAVLPLYAAQLDASPTVVGNYLSFLFLALAAGTLAGGWIAPKMRRFRQLLMVLAASSAIAIFLMGHVTMIWQLILLSVAAWFSSGITVTLVMILVGEHAEAGKRGHIFGLLTMAASLGSVLGGVSGVIVDHWGYTWLFTLAGAAWLTQVLVACFLINPSQSRQRPAAQANLEQVGEDSTPYAAVFLLLLAGALLVSVANFAGFLGRTLAMEARHFPVAMITLIGALASALGLVAGPLLGRLSDRGGRRLLLGALYLTGAFALLVVAYSRTPTHFVMVATLFAFSGTERGISIALLSDCLPSCTLGRSLSIFESIKWFGGVVGLAGTGYAIEHMGLSQTMLLSALMPVLAALLLVFLPLRKTHESQLPAPQLDPA